MPVVLEFILERVTNISMGTELHNVSEFEEILCLDPSLTHRRRLGLGPPGREQARHGCRTLRSRLAHGLSSL